MKKILAILLVMLSVTCKRTDITLPEPVQSNKVQTRSNVDRYWYTGTGGVYVNDVRGVRGTATIPNFGGGAKDKSFWWGFYYNNGLWSQLGAAKNQTWGLGIALHWYQGSTEVYPPIQLINSLTISVGDRVTFSQENVPGTTKWNYSLNGKVLYQAEIGATGGRKFEFYTEINNDRPSGYPTLIVDTTFQWKDSLEQWHPVYSSFTGASSWAMAGNYQDSTIRINSLRISYPKDKILSPGTTLWITNN